MEQPLPERRVLHGVDKRRTASDAHNERTTTEQISSVTDAVQTYISPATVPLSATGIPWVDRFEPGQGLIGGRAYAAVKRMIDLALVIAFLPVLLPLFVLIALAVKIESPDGPIMFAQQRTGKGGRRFRMHKFRSMVPNAEELKLQLAHLNELEWPDFKITNDPRVTRVGRVLRKTSLDEIPQLFNVLRGEMSLVGPRPTSFSAETYRLWQTERLDVVPGVTGLWQIIGRGETEFTDRLRLDIAYIERRCLWLDTQILFRTITAVFTARGRH
jgi:lipopolysaccharide/colanic/teichoic acid biosynthesis glycosyltransferase